MPQISGRRQHTSVSTVASPMIELLLGRCFCRQTTDAHLSHGQKKLTSDIHFQAETRPNRARFYWVPACCPRQPAELQL